MKRIVSKTTLPKFIAEVNSWNQEYNLGLTFFGQAGRRVAWIQGEKCVLARQTGPQTVECYAIGKLLELMQKHFEPGVNVWPNMEKIANDTLSRWGTGITLTPEERAEKWLSEGKEDAAAFSNEDKQNVIPQDGRRVIELLYWIYTYINGNPNQAVDLFWVSERYKENWGLKGEWLAYDTGHHLHHDIPDILHDLIASSFVVDTPVVDTPKRDDKLPEDGRFAEMEKRNGGRISIYPPFGFNLYLSKDGFNHVQWNMRQGLLRDALQKTPGGWVIDWDRADAAANKLPSFDLLQVPYDYKSSVVRFDKPDFINWVDEKIQNAPIFFVREGTITVEQLPADRSKLNEDKTRTVFGLGYRFTNLENHSVNLNDSSSIIDFEIHRLLSPYKSHEGRKSPGYKVIIKCRHQAVKPFFDDLVTEFREIWEQNAAADRLLVDYAINLTTEPAGRKPDKIYDEAYQKLGKGETAIQVFSWVCKQFGFQNPGAAERHNFKEAIRRRKRKETKGKVDT